MADWIRKTKAKVAQRQKRQSRSEDAFLPPSPLVVRTDMFRHEPLDTTRNQIRLLEIHPLALSEINEQKFELTIETFDNDNTPEYIALSYTWGAPSLKHDISLNGRCFDVRENLYNFLETFALNPQAEHYHLWIDQLCIDQTNTGERNHQVGLMSDIYHKSTFVITWLGHGAQDAAIQLQKNQGFPSIQELLNNVYFSRLWIVQEVLISQAVYIVCGNMWMKWNYLRKAILNLSETEYEQLPPAKWLFHMKEERNDGYLDYDLRRLDLSLDEAMMRYSMLGCENPCDKIYGLLGLVNSANWPVPIIDYSMSLEAVYMNSLTAIFANPTKEIAGYAWARTKPQQLVTVVQELGTSIGLSKQFMKQLKPMFKDIQVLANATNGSVEFYFGYDLSEKGEHLAWFEVEMWPTRWWYDRTGRVTKDDPTEPLRCPIWP